jgi:hypothetical protein
MYAKLSIHGQPNQRLYKFQSLSRIKESGLTLLGIFFDSRYRLTSNETQSSLSIASLQNWDTWLPVAEDQVFKAAIHTHLFWLLSLVEFCLYSGWNQFAGDRRLDVRAAFLPRS